MSTPVVIQAYLNRVAQSFLDDNFDAFRQSCRLPLSATTRTGSVHYQTQSHLQSDFEDYVAMIGLNMVTDIRREVLSVDQISPRQVVARYSTEMWSGNERVVEPYTSTAMLVFDRGAWRTTAIMGGIGKEAWREARGDATSNVIPFKRASGH